MTPRLIVDNMRSDFEAANSAPRRLAGRGSGEPPNGGDMEHRVSALEKTCEKMDAKLDKILDAVSDLKVSTARIEERLETKASSSEIAEIKGRVTALPTTWQMITLVVGIVGGILGGAFLILKFGLPHAA